MTTSVSPVRIKRAPLTPSERYYLRKTTTYRDVIWTYFSQIQDDFRLLHMPL